MLLSPSMSDWLTDFTGRTAVNFYYYSIVTISLSCIVSEIFNIK